MCVSNVEDYYPLGTEVRTPQACCSLWRHQIGHQLFNLLGVTVSSCNLSNYCSQSSYLFSLCSLSNFFPIYFIIFSRLPVLVSDSLPLFLHAFSYFFCPVWTPSCFEIYLIRINFLFAVIFHNFTRFCTKIQGLQLLTWWKMQRCGRSRHH